MFKEKKNLIDIIKNFNRYADLPYLVYRNKSELKFLNDFIKRKDINNNNNENTDIIELIKTCKKCDDIYEQKFPFGNGQNKVMILINAPVMLSNVEKKIYKIS